MQEKQRPLRVGVLALQGNFIDHVRLLEWFGGDVVVASEVREPGDLQRLDGLILPGGESTAISALLACDGGAMRRALEAFVHEQRRPVWGVCAGMILLAELFPASFGVERNAFGRQSRSTKTEQLGLTDEARALGVFDSRATFVRAPAATVRGAPSAAIALATVVAPFEGREEGRSVAAALHSPTERWMATAFHPEVEVACAWTRAFLRLVAEHAAPPAGPAVETFFPDAEPRLFPLPAPDVKRAFPRFLCGGVIMDVVNEDQARVAETAGACAVMALERIPADIKRDGGIARMSDPALIKRIMAAVTVPVMAKARIGHTAEARVLEALDVDCIDESEVLTPADEVHHIRKSQFVIPFVCGAKDLGEALRRIAEGASMIRLKGNAGTGNVMHAVRHARGVFSEIRRLRALDDDEVAHFAKSIAAPLDLVLETRKLGRLPVVTFAAGGIATPADVALMMELGCDGVFVGSGIFKGENPEARARAMVEACAHWQNPAIVARVSENLGRGMVGVLDDGETYNFVADGKL